MCSYFRYIEDADWLPPPPEGDHYLKYLGKYMCNLIEHIWHGSRVKNVWKLERGII